MHALRSGLHGPGGSRGGGDRDDDPSNRKGPPDHGRGSGSGGRKGVKKPSKKTRDRERNMHRKGGKGKAHSEGSVPPNRARLTMEYGRALKMAVAAATSRSRASRLRTWDCAVQVLAEQELIEVGPDARKLTPGLAEGRNGLLEGARVQISRAVRQHRYGAPQDQLSSGEVWVHSAARSQHLSRGRVTRFTARCVQGYGISCASKLTALNLEDVRRSDVTCTQRTALLILESKTDQELAGELVARECTCDVAEASP
eukprot:s765_g4.t1